MNRRRRCACSTNASSNKPTLVVTYKENYYGNAKSYVQKTGTGVNCLGYAMGKNASIQPSAVGADLGTMGAQTYFDNHLKQYLINSGYGNVRQIGRTEAIGSSERRIAMRTGTFNPTGITATRDFHFWRELGGSDAGLQWADKPGEQSDTSRKLTSTDNPDDNNVLGWDFKMNGMSTTQYYSGPYSIYCRIGAVGHILTEEEENMTSKQMHWTAYSVLIAMLLPLISSCSGKPQEGSTATEVSSGSAQSISATQSLSAFIFRVSVKSVTYSNATIERCANYYYLDENGYYVYIL